MSRRALLVLLAALVGACAKQNRRRQSGPAERIVSLSPSTTEAVFVVGAGDRLVGRSRYCSWPAEVEKLPQIGGYVDPSYEAILALRPDLVVGARGPAGAAIAERLDTRGVATFFPKTESIAEIDAMIVGIGERTGRVAAARAYLEMMHAKIDAIARATSTLPKKRVLLVFGLEPLSVAGPSSFPDEMLATVGGKNVVIDGGAYPTVGIERVLVLDPDVVIDASMAEHGGKDRIAVGAPGWSRLRAVAEGRVVRISDESVLRPGPRIGDGLAVLARAIHPEARLE